MTSVWSKNYFAATWMDFGVRALRIRNGEEFADAAQCRQTFCRGCEIGCCNQGRWSVRWQMYSRTWNSQSKSSKRARREQLFLHISLTSYPLNYLIRVTDGPFVALCINSWSLQSMSLCLFPLVKSCEARAEQNSLFVWFLAPPAGPLLPAYRLHFHSAVSTRTRKCSVSWYSTLVSRQTVCLCVSDVVLKLSWDSQSGELHITHGHQSTSGNGVTCAAYHISKMLKCF